MSIAEPEESATLKEGLIKTVTGGEPIPVRRLNQGFIEVIPQFKLVMTGNSKPVIKDKSEGIWRRLLLLKWPVQTDEKSRDKDLLPKLQQVRDGILNWVIKGALEYKNHGLQVPDGVRAATQEYRMTSDPIADFILSSCTVTGNEEDEVSPADIWVAYRAWGDEDGKYAYTLTQFQNALPDYTERSWGEKDGKKLKFFRFKNSRWYYRGIQLDSTLSKARPEK